MALSIPAPTPDDPSGTPPSSFPLTGRMTLHKDRGRTEELYFFQSNDMAELRRLLRNPIAYFKKNIPDQTDCPVSPVVALVRPMDQNEHVTQMKTSKALVGKAFESHMRRQGIVAESMSLTTKAAMLTAFESEAMDHTNGWFLAEFANKTHVLNIFYKAPTRAPKDEGYKGNYTIPTICTLDAVTTDSTVGQIHFDLELEPGVSMAKARADFIVDYIEDGGRRLCDNLNKHHKTKEESSLQVILRGSDGKAIAPSEPSLPTESKRFDDMTFSTMTLKGESLGPTLIVEGLSFTPMSDDGEPLETFVCLQNSGMIEGQIYLVDGTLKVYTAPPTEIGP